MSTTAPSGRWPYRYSRRAIHSGAGRAASSPWTTRAAYSGQPSASSTATEARPSAGGPVSGTVRSRGLSSLPRTRAASRAIPRMDRTSPRLGAVLMSSTLSRSPTASTASTPTGVSGGRTRIPEWSSNTPSSRAEASMPSETMPRTVRRPISGSAGSLAPGAAQGTTSPGAKLRAPQTTERSSPPASMRTSTRRSASGWGSTSSTRAVTIPARSSPTRWMVSISSPAKVSFSARVAAGTSTSTWVASQESGTRIGSPLDWLTGGLSLRSLSPPDPLHAGQPADVVVGQGAHVGQARAEHERALDAGPGGEAGDLVGVVAAGPEHVGVDHARPQQLDPALAAAGAAAVAGAAADEAGHVDLGPGLDEREVRRPQPDLAVLAEVGAGEGQQGALHVGHGDAAVDGQDLDLVEHWHVGGVGGVGPVAAAGDDDVDRRRAGLHGSDLHGRGLGAQHQLPRLAPVRPLDVEAVLHGAGRVVGGHVEGLEVIPVGLDLGPLDDPVAEADEDVDDLVDGPGDGVDGPAGRDPAGEGDVDPLGLEQGLVPLGLQLGPAGGQLGLEGGAGLVDAAAEVAAGLLAEAAEGPLDLAQGRALGQVGLLGLAQLVQVGGVGDRPPPRGDDLVQVRGWHGGAPWEQHGQAHSSAERSPRSAGCRLGDAGQLQAPAGQAKSQGGALAGGRVGPDAAAVGLDQAAGDEQPQPGAAGRPRAGPPVELGEDQRQLVGRDADAVVTHGHLDLGAGRLPGDRDLAAVGVLHRVLHQVGEDLLDLVGVSIDAGEVVGERDLEAVAVVLEVEAADDPFRHGGQVELGAAQLQAAGVDPGDVQ